MEGGVKMNYSQNTGYTNSTKKLLCVWIEEETYNKLLTWAKAEDRKLSDVVRGILDNIGN